MTEPNETHADVDDEAAGSAFDIDTVILAARLDVDVARRVSVASNREGVSIADLLGRAAAAYNWSERSAETGESPGSTDSARSGGSDVSTGSARSPGDDDQASSPS